MAVTISKEFKNVMLEGMWPTVDPNGPALMFDSITISNVERAGVRGVDVAYHYQGKDIFYVFTPGATISEPIHLHGFTGRMPFEINAA